MVFEENKMYKNILKDTDTAFIVDKVVSRDKTTGTRLMVTWYQKNKNGIYSSMNIDGEYHIPKLHEAYYMEV